MSFRNIDANFAAGGQISLDEVKSVADAGFRTIICARPDNEDPGQPSFSMIAREAAKYGVRAVHIPVSGAVTEDAMIQMAHTLGEMPKPMFGYCRSGNRASTLYGHARQAGH